MEIFGFQTIEGYPAIYHPELNLVAVSDLHLGLEKSMTSKGSYVPQFQLEEVIDELRDIQEETYAEKILLNGDLKNEFNRSSYSEKQEVRDLLEALQDTYNDVIVVQGNHDNFIEETVEKQGLRLMERFETEEVLFTHGHREIEDIGEFETVVIGHEHPSLSLEDEIGVVERVDCLLYGEADNGTGVIVLPAFSKISNGTRVNETPKSELLSPVLRNSISFRSMKAVAISREAGNFSFPELREIH